jgi:uncharacterized protein YecT (DUF1311 family)
MERRTRSRLRLFLLAAAALAVSAGTPESAHAQAQHDRCSQAKTQTDINACAARDHRAADAELNRAYTRLMSVALPARREGIRVAQRAWIAFRDAHCRSEASEYQGGSMQPMVLSFCLADVTRSRTAQLKERIEEVQGR